MSKTNRLITTDIDTLLKKIAFPASIGLFFNTLFHVVDTIYVSKISTHSLSALSYSSMLLFFFLAINFGFSIATRVHIGFYLAKKKNRLVKVFIENSIYLVLIFALILTITNSMFLKEIFLLMGAKGVSLDFAINYTSVILLSIIPMFLSLNINATLSAQGDTKTYRNVLIIGLILNIILNPIFIYGYGFIPSFGFIGVALSTLLIHIISFLYMIKKLYDTKLIEPTKILKYRPSRIVLKKILEQAFPSSLNMILMALGNILLITFISHYGYKAVAAYGIGYRIEQLILLPLLGLNVAITVLVSNNLGAKKIDRINEVFHKSIKYALLLSLLGVALLISLGNNIISLFDNDLTVNNIAYEYIVYKALALIGTSLIFICIAMIQGLKKPKIIPYINLLRQIIIPAIAIYIIVYILNYDISKIWICIVAITYLASFYLIYYLKRLLLQIKE